MMDECHLLLRPGVVGLHLEVPQRYAEMDLWGQVRGEIEARYNNEPNWKAATSADYVALLGQAGYRDIAVGYQDATDAAARGNAGFGATSKGVFRSEEHTSELQSLMRNSYAVYCLKQRITKCTAEQEIDSQTHIQSIVH